MANLKRFISYIGGRDKIKANMDYLSYLDETIYFYYTIRNTPYLPEKCPKGNLKEIHDVLSRLCIDAKREEREHKYADLYKNHNKPDLDFEYNGYKFKVATSASELAQIGNIMKICVGNYVESVFDGRSNIIYVMKDGDYIMCMDIYKNTINQAKLSCNRIMDAQHPILNILIKYINNKSLKINTNDLHVLMLNYNPLMSDEDTDLLNGALLAGYAYNAA